MPSRLLACLCVVLSCGPAPIEDTGGGGGSASGGGSSSSGGGSSSSGGGSSASGGGDASTGGGSALGGGSAAGGGDASGGGSSSSGGGSAIGGGTGGGDVDAGLATVSFSYNPSWDGVTQVDVIGSFTGTANDWTTPLLSLTSDGGAWTGSTQLPDGTYAYLFRVKGDAQGPGNIQRYAIDPLNPAFAACPPSSPTYSANMNPCAELTVPQASPATTHAITGKVDFDGVGTPGYLVILERDETSTHHYFADRATTDSSGNFTLHAAEGSWRVQIWYPTLQTKKDSQRNPLALQAQRRMLSNPFSLTADLSLPTAELAFHDYNAMTPNDAGQFPLPATFSFTRASWASGVRLALYGSVDAGSDNIGDPWFASKYFDGGSSVFDGGFPTAQADEPSARPGERYFWGTWHQPTDDGGVQWTAESMVFPVHFQ